MGHRWDSLTWHLRLHLVERYYTPSQLAICARRSFPSTKN